MTSEFPANMPDAENIDIRGIAVKLFEQAAAAANTGQAVPSAQQLPLPTPFPRMPQISSLPSPPSFPSLPALPQAAKVPPFPPVPDYARVNYNSFPHLETRLQPNALQQLMNQPGLSSHGLEAVAQAFQRVGMAARIQPPGPGVFDVEQIRRDFPVLHQNIHGKPLVWLDNAATTQKPQTVIDSISNFYRRDNSNIHRGAHALAARATDAWENARQSVQEFLGAAAASEIIFLRGTTEAINLVAQTIGRCFLRPGDEILLTVLEHHANIVPWQMAAKETGAVIKVVPVNDRGEILLEAYESLLSPKTKLVSLTHASNSLGTILPVEQMTAAAKRYNAMVLIDGAQTVSHMPVNVQTIGCDFFVFSGHKLFAPTGIGALYAKQDIQQVMPPWQGGGNMIRTVTFEETTYSDPPAKFEAGTPSVADAVGLHAAIQYITAIGWPAITRHEHELLEYGTARLLEIPGLRLIGQARQKVGVLSFVIPGKSVEEIGKYLDQEGIAVRAGHHCAQPSLRRFGLDATVRPSLAFYNTTHDLDRLADALHRLTTNH
jgi:cysteine desulfurase/selenocysteine lyase